MNVVWPQVDVEGLFGLGRLLHEGDGLVYKTLGDL